MESSTGGRCGEIVSDISVALVTVAQLVFLIFFHQYIAWYTTGPDGSATRQSLLTDEYFTWLPFPIVASIVVIVATILMILYNRHWFRQAVWIVFCLMGIAVVVSLVCIFPFDFSVIPNSTASELIPKALTIFLILMAVFYGTSALVLLVKWRRRAAKREPA